MNFNDAAAIMEQWVTAYQLMKIADLKPEDEVLILAGASGVGTCLIQLCKLYGAYSIAVASSTNKIQACKK